MDFVLLLDAYMPGSFPLKTELAKAAPALPRMD